MLVLETQEIIHLLTFFKKYLAKPIRALLDGLSIHHPLIMQTQSVLSAASHRELSPRSTLVSRNVSIAGHRTSVRLEPPMWDALGEISRRECATLHEICTAIARRKTENTSLTAAIRSFIMAYYRAAATEEGHARAGHGQGTAINGVTVSNAQSAPSRSSEAQPSIAPISMQHSPFMIGAKYQRDAATGKR